MDEVKDSYVLKKYRTDDELTIKTGKEKRRERRKLERKPDKSMDNLAKRLIKDFK